jgi:transcriptional regulator
MERRIADAYVAAMSENSRSFLKMITLREKGYSYRKIAEILDTMQIPTKTHKRKWQARVVHGILNRVKVTQS